MSKNCQPRDSFTIWQSTLMTMQRSHLISKMGEIIKLTALGDENLSFLNIDIMLSYGSYLQMYSSPLLLLLLLLLLK